MQVASMSTMTAKKRTSMQQMQHLSRWRDHKVVQLVSDSMHLAKWAATTNLSISATFSIVEAWWRTHRLTIWISQAIRSTSILINRRLALQTEPSLKRTSLINPSKASRVISLIDQWAQLNKTCFQGRNFQTRMPRWCYKIASMTKMRALRWLRGVKVLEVWHQKDSNLKVQGRNLLKVLVQVEMAWRQTLLRILQWTLIWPVPTPFYSWPQSSSKQMCKMRFRSISLICLRLMTNWASRP